ncbi:hypothetical protein [Methylobacterium sp. SD21]|uniref:AAA family ATPase n=1 Tax=Methylobacterium litchii TaxID=3138810 RepID=UPI00313E3072
MRSFIVGLDPGEVARLARLSAAIGFPVGVLPGLDALRLELARPGVGRALVLLPDLGLTRDAVRLAAEHGDTAFIVVVADTIPPDDYKALVRTGAGEWIQWGSCEVELADLVKRFAAPAHAGNGARIVTFAPSKGGVGNTSLVAEMGVLLSGPKAAGGRSGSRVAVLDLNFQGGTLADTLAVEPRFDLAEVAGRPERLDEQLAEVFLSCYADRLDVFAPPPRLVMLDDITPNLVFTFIDTISPRYDLVLVDLPSVALGWTETLIEGSDAVVVTGIATVPGLRRLCDRLSRIDDLSTPARRLAVVNQADTDMMGRFVRRAEVDRLLAGRDNLLVRRDCAGMETAANSGQPLVEIAPDGRLGRDIRRIAKWIEAVAARPAESARGSAA